MTPSTATVRKRTGDGADRRTRTRRAGSRRAREVVRLWPISVLVVSQDRCWRSTVAMLIGRRDRPALTAAGEREAVELASRERIDVVVIERPERGGAAAAGTSSVHSLVVVDRACDGAAGRARGARGRRRGRRAPRARHGGARRSSLELDKWGPFDELFARDRRAPTARAGCRANGAIPALAGLRCAGRRRRLSPGAAAADTDTSARPADRGRASLLASPCPLQPDITPRRPPRAASSAPATRCWRSTRPTPTACCAPSPRAREQAERVAGGLRAGDPAAAGVLNGFAGTLLRPARGRQLGASPGWPGEAVERLAARRARLARRGRARGAAQSLARARSSRGGRSTAVLAVAGRLRRPARRCRCGRPAARGAVAARRGRHRAAGRRRRAPCARADRRASPAPRSRRGGLVAEAGRARGAAERGARRAAAPRHGPPDARAAGGGRVPAGGDPRARDAAGAQRLERARARAGERAPADAPRLRPARRPAAGAAAASARTSRCSASSWRRARGTARQGAARRAPRRPRRAAASRWSAGCGGSPPPSTPA